MIAALEVSGLALARGDRRLVDGLDLRLAAGEAMVVEGPNGSGKTSLLRAIAGLLRPEAGAISFRSGDDAALDPEEARTGGLHFLGHADGLAGGRRAGDELAFWARWLGGGAHDLARAAAAFDLAPLLPLEVRRLSAGQRRRLSLARLLAAPRALWLLDEPLAPLDATTRARFGELMATHLAGGGLVLAAAHDPLPVPARTLALRAPIPA